MSRARRIKKALAKMTGPTWEPEGLCIDLAKLNLHRRSEILGALLMAREDLERILPLLDKWGLIK